MDTTSEYTFPIFISSTDYNLKDFRAELSRFLLELGYRPILSSAEGFPDSSPNLEPWESCIPVLSNCFVMILIIDGRYSSALGWPNLPEIFKDLKVSPTHGEYMFAHKNAKRMLVFIRREVMTYYQSYRQTLNSCSYDEIKTKETLSKTLPEYIDYDTLKFVHEVKTSKPIPWIKEFDDVTDVKKEVQKKMLNELAEIFLVKNQHLQTVIDSFNKVLGTMTPEEQQKALTKINATKPFIEAFERTQSLTKELEEANSSLEKVAGSSSKERKKLTDRIKKLENEIRELENSTDNTSFDMLFMKDGNVQLSDPEYVEVGSPSNGASIYPFYSLSGKDRHNYYRSPYMKYCDECNKADLSVYVGTVSPLIVKEFNNCPKCRRHLCRNCWPRISGISTKSGITLEESCRKCSEK